MLITLKKLNLVELLGSQSNVIQVQFRSKKCFLISNLFELSLHEEWFKALTNSRS